MNDCFATWGWWTNIPRMLQRCWGSQCGVEGERESLIRRSPLIPKKDFPIREDANWKISHPPKEKLTKEKWKGRLEPDTLLAIKTCASLLSSYPCCSSTLLLTGGRECCSSTPLLTGGRVCCSSTLLLTGGRVCCSSTLFLTEGRVWSFPYLVEYYPLDLTDLDLTGLDLTRKEQQIMSLSLNRQNIYDKITKETVYLAIEAHFQSHLQYFFSSIFRVPFHHLPAVQTLREMTGTSEEIASLVLCVVRNYLEYVQNHSREHIPFINEGDLVSNQIFRDYDITPLQGAIGRKEKWLSRAMVSLTIDSQVSLK